MPEQVSAERKASLASLGIDLEEGGHDRSLIEDGLTRGQITGHSVHRRPRAMGPRGRH